MLLDANLLLYAVHKQSEQHEAAADWLTEQLNGARRVGLPWQSVAAFLRIATHPRGGRSEPQPAMADADRARLRSQRSTSTILEPFLGGALPWVSAGGSSKNPATGQSSTSIVAPLRSSSTMTPPIASV
jgi:predicted nucleic acid-binding protein